MSLAVRRHKYREYEKLDMAQYGIIAEGRNCWSQTWSSRVAFLIDGEAYFSTLAQTVERAERSVLMIGWDFDSRTDLFPRAATEEKGDGFARFLTNVLNEKPALHVYILGWDFAMIYAFEREVLPALRFGSRVHPRLHFRLDGNHPFGGSHHQKVVVVDDAVAFAGGFDITKRRWDTPEHRPKDLARVDPAGVLYAPFHDVQMMVDGETAGQLGNLARYRWHRATGEHLSPVPSESDPWPSGLRPDTTDCYVAISRTEPAYQDNEEVREVENLFFDSISAARREIYIENQYFTSLNLAEALALRLEEQDGPEIVIVTPKEPTGLLEESTMGVLRARLLEGVRKRDVHRRLRVYYPAVPGLSEKECLNVHSKVMVVDNRFLRIGSANLTNRSMGLDTECDLSIEAGVNDDRLRQSITKFRNRLLAEHLGSSEERIETVYREKQSLVAAIEALRGEGRTLEEVNDRLPEWLDGIMPDAAVLDPERPIDSELVFNQIVAGKEQPVRHPFLKAGVLIGGILALVLLWHYGPLRKWFSLDAIEVYIETFRGSASAPFVVAAAFVIGSLLLVPLTLLIMATILAFDPFPAFIYAMGGGLCAAAAGFAVGRLLGRDIVRRLAGERINVLTRKLVRRSVLAVVVARMIPLFPFTVVNLVAGASKLGFKEYLIGTAIGLSPGLLLLTLFEKGLEHAIHRPGMGSFAILAGVILLAILILRYFRIMLTAADKYESKDLKQKNA